MAFTEVTVTGAYVRDDGTTVASGKVTFERTAALQNGTLISAPFKRTVTLDGAGEVSVTLVATDDVGTNPTGATYEVLEELEGCEPRIYRIEVPHASATLDLATAAPVLNAQVYRYALTTALDAETAARAAADTTLQTAIDAETAARSAHEADTTGVHGIADTSQLATLDDISALSFQPLDSDLTAIAALTTTTFGRALLTMASAAATRSTLGLGTAAVADSTAFDAAGAASAAQTAAIAASQPLDSDLTAIAALSTTTFGRALLTLADAAAVRADLGLGTAATAATTDFDAAGAAAAVSAAASAALAAHESDTTAIHGIADTSQLATLSGAQTFTGTKTFPTTGIVIGAATLHEVSAGKLEADNDFTIDGLLNLTSDANINGSVIANHGGTSKLVQIGYKSNGTGSPAAFACIEFGNAGTANLYRESDSVIATDVDLHVLGNLTVDGTLSASGLADVNDPMAFGFVSNSVNLQPSELSATAAAQGVANWTVYSRLVAAGYAITSLRMEVYNASGNVCVSIYGSTGTGASRAPSNRRASSGSIPCPSAGGGVDVSLGSTVTPLITDYSAFGIDNTTATLTRMTTVASAQTMARLFGRVAMENTFPAPATAAPVTTSAGGTMSVYSQQGLV